jgi:hypothetical protein
MTDHVFEILEEAAKAPSRVEKQQVLQDNNCLALRDIIKGAYDDSIQFSLLPKGEPPFTPAEEPTASLMDKSKTLRYFVKGGPGEKLPAAKREAMFIELLESIHPKELKHYMFRLEKEGKDQLAKKVKVKYEYLNSKITDLEAA